MALARGRGERRGDFLDLADVGLGERRSRAQSRSERIGRLIERAITIAASMPATMEMSTANAYARFAFHAPATAIENGMAMATVQRLSRSRAYAW